MKLTQIRWKSLLLAVALCLSLAVPALATAQGTVQQATDNLLETIQATSMQYALIQGDKITETGRAGVYSKTENTALTKDHLYGIGSVSKMYTTVAVMKLAEEGKLELDAPVTRYLPEFTMEDARYRQITVRMLLNHSSGLMGGTIKDAFLFGDSSSAATEELLDRLKTQRLKADPGAYSVYCNDGFTLAELVVERVSGMSFTDYLHQTITQPLGLQNTGTPKDAFADNRFAKTYYGTNPNALPKDTLGIIGTGGVYASAEDLAIFGSIFYTDKVLSQKSLDAMAAPEYAKGVWYEDSDQSLSYGLGWDSVELVPFRKTGIQALSKGGDTLLYHASLVVLPEYDMAAAVVSSGGASTYNQALASRLLIDALAKQGVKVDESVPALPETKPAPIPASELAKAGYYGTTASGLHIEITEEGKLTMEGLPDLVLTYQEDGSYRDENNAMLVKLVEESDGEVYAYQKAYGVIPGLPPITNAAYFGQLLPKQELPDSVWQAWEAQAEDVYYIVNERYTSQLYALQFTMSMPISREKMPDGYVYGSKIVDETKVQPVVTVPGAGSRDYQVIERIEQDGKSYLKVNDFLAVSSQSIPSLYIGSSARCTIQADGYARWYQVGEVAGQQMNVTLPKDGRFYVYDGKGTVTAASIFGDSGGVLPEGGMVVFVGEPGAAFELSIRSI